MGGDRRPSPAPVDTAVAGVIGKPVGLGGDVLVRPDPDLDDQFEVGSRYRAGESGACLLTVTASRTHAGRRIVRFDGVADRDAARVLRGTLLMVARADVALDADAFWSDELLGREVVDAGGDPIGVVAATADGPAHDYLVIARPDGREVLVPAVAELVEVAGERIVVHAIPGLLDDPA